MPMPDFAVPYAAPTPSQHVSIFTSLVRQNHSYIQRSSEETSLVGRISMEDGNDAYRESYTSLCHVSFFFADI